MGLVFRAIFMQARPASIPLCAHLPSALALANQEKYQRHHRGVLRESDPGFQFARPSVSITRISALTAIEFSFGQSRVMSFSIEYLTASKGQNHKSGHGTLSRRH